MSVKGDKKRKAHVISAEGELKLKMMKYWSWQSTRMPHVRSVVYPTESAPTSY